MDFSQSKSVGNMLRDWRKTKGISQLQLACEAQVSARHISFVETGRSQPSREMLLLLSTVLDIPLRERNTLLLLAGYAPAYRTSELDDPQLEHVRNTLRLIIDKHEPYAALVMDDAWDLIMVNDSATRLREAMCQDVEALLKDGPPNLLRLLFHPLGVRQSIVNWEDVARSTLIRVHRQQQINASQRLTKVIEQVLAYPGVPKNFYSPSPQTILPVMIPICFRLGEYQIDLFSTVTTLGSALDVTLQDLHIEVFYPANEHSEKLLSRLAMNLLTKA